MKFTILKVFICLFSISGLLSFCEAQSDNLQKIFPDKGLVDTIDKFTDSLARKYSYPFLSFVTITRYAKFGLLFWQENERYRSLRFYFRKNEMIIRPIKRKYKNLINVKMLLESKCSYKEISECGKDGISQDHVMRVKTKDQEVYFWYSNYLACYSTRRNSCVNNLSSLMGWGF